jgi:fructan beta-fructosidase
MLVSVSNGSPNGGSGTQYFIGDFDGTTFTNSFPAATIHWLDQGSDDYAGVTFSDIPREDGRRIFLGWMNNWWYAQDVPTSPWRGAMTVPRQLVLQASHSGQLQLVSVPIPELQALRGRSIRVNERIIPDSTKLLVADSLTGGAFEIIVEYQWETASEFGLIVANELDDRTVVGYNVSAQKMFVDRRNSGVVDFSRDFAHGVHSAPLPSEADLVKLHVFVDWSSIEVIADDGGVLLTHLVLPRGSYNRLELYARGGDVHVPRCEVWETETVWRE